MLLVKRNQVVLAQIRFVDFQGGRSPLESDATLPLEE